VWKYFFIDVLAVFAKLLFCLDSGEEILATLLGLGGYS
jgi:hypothetical protein